MSTKTVPLRRFCMARSGDKGDSVDISLFAPNAAVFELLKTSITAERVATFFAGMAKGPAQRYELPNLLALKFVVQGALGGGAAGSLRSDNLGKAYGANLLHLTIDMPEALLAECPDMRHPDSR
jgi:hypothetical protein